MKIRNDEKLLLFLDKTGFLKNQTNRKLLLDLTNKEELIEIFFDIGKEKTIHIKNIFQGKLYYKNHKTMSSYYLVLSDGSLGIVLDYESNKKMLNSVLEKIRDIKYSGTEQVSFRITDYDFDKENGIFRIGKIKSPSFYYKVPDSLSDKADQFLREKEITHDISELQEITRRMYLRGIGFKDKGFSLYYQSKFNTFLESMRTYLKWKKESEKIGFSFWDSDDYVLSFMRDFYKFFRISTVSLLFKYDFFNTSPSRTMELYIT